MRSLTTRVAVAGGLVALILVMLVGMTAFVALRQQVRQSLQETAFHAAWAEGQRLATIVEGVRSDLISNAANALIANGLADTIGRDAYVVPFLRDIQAVQGVPMRVIMTDHRGHRLAGSSEGAVTPAIAEAARRAMAEVQPVGQLDNGAVVLAAPIIYAASGTAEGALVYAFSVTGLPVGHQDGGLIERIEVLVVEDEQADAAPGSWGTGRHVERLGNGLSLVATAHVGEDALLAPERRLLWTFIVMGGGCLAVVVMASAGVAEVMTRHLRRLEADSARVVATASFSQRFKEEGGDEVARLAHSFNAVLDRLEEAHRGLAAQAARDLEASEERYRLLAEHASDIISRIGADGTVRYVSPAITRLLGYQPQDVVGATLCDLVHPGECPTVSARLESGDAPVTFRMHRARGDYVWVEATAHRLGSSEQADMVVIIRDITRRKQAEDALAEKTEDLERSNAELEQFAYVASHDMREPLRMVTNYLQMIDRKLGAKDEDMTAFMGFAIDGARRMDRLILDLLEFSRVGRNRPPFEPVSLDEIVARAAMTFERAAAEKGGGISVQGPLPTVEGDRQELERLFQNLIGNAVKYMPPDRAPMVRVWSERTDDETVVVVADNGIGIAPEHRDRVFVIFQRLHARGSYEGTGVGLAICKKIVERHQGRIWVESAEGEGSVFRVAFPLPARAEPLPPICRPARMIPR